MRIVNSGFGPLTVIAVAIVVCGPACSPRIDRAVPEHVSEFNGDAGGERAPSGAERVSGAEKARAGDASLLAEGKVAWRSCAKCHCATDPRIPQDDDWIRLNEETTCIEAGRPAPRIRKSILAYLRHPETLRPVLVTRDAPPGITEKTGKVLLPRTAGSAYLRADRGSIKTGTPSMVRLGWDAAEQDVAMAVPAGRYGVINFWFYRHGGTHGDERWMVTGTNVNGCTSLDIHPESEEILDLEPALYGHFTAKRTDKGYGLSFSIQDAGGTRMTLSRNGRVVMPGYRILDAEGKTIVEGAFGIT